jgi:hypothetical protein
MNLLRKIAKPCGILGGVWGILVSLMGLLLMPAATLTAVMLIVTFLVGVLAILGTLFRQRSLRLTFIVLWAGSIIYLTLGILTGPYFYLPAAILLFVAVMGGKKPQGAVGDQPDAQ